MNTFKLPSDGARRAASPRGRRCECYGCRLAAGLGDDARVPREQTPQLLSAPDLNARLLQITPASEDTEEMVDALLGLALGAFDAREITEAQFRDLSAKCLDALTFLAR